MKTYDDFETLYQPIKNHLNKLAANEGTWFETFGKEELFVRNIDNKRIWTIVEGDEHIWLIAGFHHVNRLGYLITKSVWKSTTEIYRFDN